MDIRFWVMQAAPGLKWQARVPLRHSQRAAEGDTLAEAVWAAIAAAIEEEVIGDVGDDDQGLLLRRAG